MSKHIEMVQALAEIHKQKVEATEQYFQRLYGLREEEASLLEGPKPVKLASKKPSKKKK